MNINAVILAGGSGTRFWPLSREATPKQMLRVFGDKTMVQHTAARLEGLVTDDNIYVVTGKKYAFDIRGQMSEVCDPGMFNMVVEPEGKNTAPAIGLAAVRIRKKNPSAVMVVMPSDHVILKNSKFRNIIKQAGGLAELGFLTTIGIVPDRPETGYGYIQKGPVLDKKDPASAFRVRRFVEKPDLKKAEKYVSSGSYLWNSGIFVWRAADILGEMKRQLPELHAGLLEIEKALGGKNEAEKTESVFKKLKSISIDYGIMEHAKNVAVVPADIGWNDVGSWRALDDISEKDAKGNVIAGNVINIGSRDSIIYAGKRLVAAVGIENTIVVDTPDATLICGKDHAQEVRSVVDELRKKGADELLEHTTVNRPWGSYTLLEMGDRYKIKRIVVNPGAKLSYQLHHHRSEHWVVVSGTARVTVGEQSYNVHPNESTYVPISTRHRLENPGKVPLQMIEVQNGDYLAEDDIIRFDDDYGR
ncbi:MAG: mannose-1-phosphate guanylyltransferase/mannose-6-phosphate isomerase [Nitrospirae bacterium]|nr:mannose-1-phosphate guanylyltransferase/mannose-6-phosphate isomerase [Nitrospirota bacterium]